MNQTQDVGIGKGKHYALNFPLRDGISDENYKSVFEPVSNTAEQCQFTKCLSNADHTTSDGII